MTVRNPETETDPLRIFIKEKFPDLKKMYHDLVYRLLGVDEPANAHTF